VDEHALATLRERRNADLRLADRRRCVAGSGRFDGSRGLDALGAASRAAIVLASGRTAPHRARHRPG